MTAPSGEIFTKDLMASTLSGMQGPLAPGLDLSAVDGSLSVMLSSTPGHRERLNLANYGNGTITLTSSTSTITLATSDKTKSLAIFNDGTSTRFSTSGTRHQFVGGNNTSDLSVHIHDPMQTTLTIDGPAQSLNVAAATVRLTAEHNVVIKAPCVELRSGQCNGKHVLLRGDHPGNVVAINPDKDFSGVTVSAPLTAADGLVTSTISSAGVLRLNAEHVVITGRLDILQQQDVTQQNMVIMLGTRSDRTVELPDVQYDGAGIVLDNIADNVPTDHPPIAQGLRWHSRAGYFDTSGAPVNPTMRSRWEVSGGNLFLNGVDGTSFMLAPADGVLNFYKIVHNGDGTETATLLHGLS